MQITTQQLSEFDVLVKNTISGWQKIKPVATSWLGVDKNSLTKGFGVVINGVDQLVSLAEKFDVPGADKKAAVLGAANALFDAIITPELPALARPFAGVLKNIMDSVLDNLIEYIVTKLVASTPATK